LIDRLARLLDKIQWSTFTGPFIATLALLFTVGSFWWLQARQGRLRSYPPHTFALALNPGQAVFRFPLVLYNTGPKPIIVKEMRLSFPKETGIAYLLWRASMSQIKPDANDARQLPAVFSVPGRTAQQHFIEFGIDQKDPLPGIDLKGQEYLVLVEVLLGHKRKWRRLVSFPLQGQHIDSPGAYLAWSNTALRPIS
jgi:hypothetical protein